MNKNNYKILYKSYQSFFTGSWIIFLGSAFQIVFIFFADAILSRFLQPTGFGIINLAKSVVLVASAISLFGTQTGLRRFIALYLQECAYGKLRGLLILGFGIVTGSGIVISLFVYLNKQWLQDAVFHQPEIAAVFGVMAFGIFFVNLKQFGLSLIAGAKRPLLKIIQVNFLEPSLVVGICIISVVFALPLLSVVKLYFGMYAVIGLSALLFGFKSLPKSLFKDRSLVFPVRIFFKFSAPLIFTTVSAILIENMDRLMIGWFCDIQSVGIYSVTTPYTRLVYSILGGFGFMYLPTVTGLLNTQSMNEVRQLNSAVAKWSMVLAFPITLLIFCRSSELLTMVFGSSYIGASHALQVVIIGSFIHAAVGMTGMNLVAYGRTDLQMIGKVLVLVINAILNIVLIPIMGIVGAAWGTTLALVLSNIVNLWFVYRTMHFQPFDATYLRTLISLLIAGGLATILANQIVGIWGIVLQTLLFGAIWLFLALFLDVFTPQDRALVKILLRKIGLVNI